MKEQNGVRIHAGDEVPNELKEIRLEDIRFPYGIKFIVQKDGTKHWVPGTREDFRTAESQRLGRDVGDMDSPCTMGMPPNCTGGCPIPGFCAILVNGSYHYCGCQLA